MKVKAVTHCRQKIMLTIKKVAMVLAVIDSISRHKEVKTSSVTAYLWLMMKKRVLSSRSDTSLKPVMLL